MTLIVGKECASAKGKKPGFLSETGLFAYRASAVWRWRSLLLVHDRRAADLVVGQVVVEVRQFGADAGLDEAREGTIAVADDFFQQFHRRLSLSFFLALIKELSQRRSGDVVLGFVVDDPEIFAAFDHLGDFVERDVAGLVSVVELPVLVALDDLHFFHVFPLAKASVLAPPVV